MLYSLATLGSAFVLVYVGGLIDRCSLRLYTSGVIAGLGVACLWMSQVSNVWMLGLGYFLLRLFGQGLSSHVATTTVSRLGRTNVGKSLSVSGLGFSVGEATIPVLVVTALTVWDWQWSQIFLLVGCAQLLVTMVSAQFLINAAWDLNSAGTSSASANPAIGAIASNTAASNTATSNTAGGVAMSWTRGQFLGDRRFYAIAPALFSPALFGTAIMFHQESLVMTKSFSFSAWTANLILYAGVSVFTSLLVGELVDRFSGGWVMRIFLLPYVIAFSLLACFDFASLPSVFFATLALTNGIYMPAVSAMWREVYGPENLGAIRAVVHAAMVFSSALGPTLFGSALDVGFSWPQILLMSAAAMLLFSLPLLLVPMRFQPHVDGGK